MRFVAHPTPNPNSLKLERADGQPIIAEGMRSYTSPAQAAADPLGTALFAIPGVTGVFAWGFL
ncbi:MAG TPA: NifU N-terminal domain-containing protein, partial [Rhodothermales bacterium]|nr:NifU N-terminal domain-containing protein [Rhodothermales bacterium]